MSSASHAELDRLHLLRNFFLYGIFDRRFDIRRHFRYFTLQVVVVRRELLRGHVMFSDFFLD